MEAFFVCLKTSYFFYEKLSKKRAKFDTFCSNHRHFVKFEKNKKTLHSAIATFLQINNLFEVFFSDQNCGRNRGNRAEPFFFMCNYNNLYNNDALNK